ncbi:MAG: hydroxyacid dehydrogenase [Hadesarchaea archaeon]|nr:hydroxyacid dehydrogenase [Hadesarchaea archaeon]
MINILVTEPKTYDDENIAMLKEIGNVECRRMNRKELLKRIENFEILVIRMETRIDKELINRAKKLKIIATGTTGLDHIDVAYAEQKNVRVISLKGAIELLKNVPSTAEHTFALLLSLIRKIPWAFDSIRKEGWNRSKFFGVELNGKTLGMIGFGRLGTIVTKIAKGFGMNVIAFDPYINQKKMDEAGVSPLPFEKLLKKSDVISIHATLTPETENMISHDEFKLMKRGVVLINTARGRIIDEKALLYALQNKLIAGAALDVLANEASEESPVIHNPLVKYAKNNENLIITPHLGGGTFEAQKKTGVYLVQKIKELVPLIFSQEIDDSN